MRFNAHNWNQKRQRIMREVQSLSERADRLLKLGLDEPQRKQAYSRVLSALAERARQIDAYDRTHQVSLFFNNPAREAFERRKS